MCLVFFIFQSDGWDTEPFVLTEKDGKLYGRGSTDDKASLFCFLLLQISSDIEANEKIYLLFHHNWIISKNILYETHWSMMPASVSLLQYVFMVLLCRLFHSIFFYIIHPHVKSSCWIPSLLQEKPKYVINLLSIDCCLAPDWWCLFF